MASRASQGGVFHVPNCPGLHGGASKARYVVVVHPPNVGQEDGVLVVPTSSSSLGSAYLVPMPNQQDHPECRSGLPRRCDAVCDQPMYLPSSALTDRRGSVSGVLVNRILTVLRAYLREKGKIK